MARVTTGGDREKAPRRRRKAAQLGDRDEHAHGFNAVHSIIPEPGRVSCLRREFCLGRGARAGVALDAHFGCALDAHLRCALENSGDEHHCRKPVP